MKTPSASTLRLATLVIGAVAVATISLKPGPVAAADDYPAVTYERLTSAQSDPGWLTYYRTYNGQAHSQLTQIDTSNVKNLKQTWAYKFPADLQQGFEATPIVNGRFMFVTTPKDNVYAFDATSGKQLWKYEPKLGDESFKTACCDVVNRGVALYGKNVYVAMLSGEVAALDAQTGALVWKKEMFEPGESATHFRWHRSALDGAIVVGKFRRRICSARGFIAAVDPNEGKVLWKRYTFPGAKEKNGGHMARRHAGTWRRARVADGHLRRRIEDALLGRRQSGTVARRSASGRQPVFRLAARARSKNRQPQMALPVHASRHLGL